MTTKKKKSNNFLFQKYSNRPMIPENRLLCRDCAYWRPNESRTDGYCSRTKNETSLITRCYQTLEEMYGHEMWIEVD